MSDALYFEQMLKSSGCGYAVFDQHLTLIDHNLRNTSYFDTVEVQKFQTNLWDMIPELVGSEDIIQELLSGKKRKYSLEKINKVDKSGKLNYYDLTFSPLRDKQTSGYQFFCLVSDVTEDTAREQEIRHKKYEIQLLQSQLANQGQFLSDSLLGQSPKMADVRAFVNKIAVHNTTVLLQGESGTGKSLVARLIHRTSRNPLGPFVEINCAAIPSTLLESELFGYEKGAFTNALMSKKGLLEEAHGGTLFLDEIGEMPLSLQAKLLTFLESRTFRRLGSNKEQTVDLRLIAATNKDLRTAIANSEFRQDLFFRINVVAIVLPPLRDLDDDIIMLANHFVSLLRFDMKKNIKGLTERAKKKLKQYDWPGNVRELRNAIERAVIFAQEPWIDSQDLALSEESAVPGPDVQDRFHIPDEGISLEEVERRLLLESLRKTRGNQSRSAKLLNLSLDTFRYRLKKFDIVPQSFR